MGPRRWLHPLLDQANDPDCSSRRPKWPGARRAADSDAHVATFDGTRVGVLLCGEVYNPALAQSLAAARVDLVVDLGHRSMTRVTRSLERIARTTEATVLHVQHVAPGSYGAAKWRATPSEIAPAHDHAWASYDREGWKPGSMWAEVKIWTV